MQEIVDLDTDKRQYHELLSSFKISEDKNRHLMSEIIQARRQFTDKEQALAQAEQKLVNSERQLAV